MYADFKITLWERIKIPKELEKEFEKKITEEKFMCPHEAIRLLKTVSSFEHEWLDDTIQFALTENNDGEATFQVFDNNHNLLFSNDNQ